MNSRNPEDDFKSLAAEGGESESKVRSPSSLKSRIYSAMIRAQVLSGPLLGLDECHAEGRGLCVFEHLVRIAPIDKKVKALNPCTICHARVLAEKMNHAPIYWANCPYVKFQER